MQADCLLLESQLISSRSMTTAEQNTNVLIRGERKAFDSLVQRYTYLKKDVSYERDNALWYKFSNGFNVYSHDTSRTEAIEGWKSLYKQMLNECETKHKDAIMKCRTTQRGQRQTSTDEHTSSGLAPPQDIVGGETRDDPGESNPSCSLTINSTTTGAEEGRGSVSEAAAPRTISWNDIDEARQESESYNSSLLRRAKEKTHQHMAALNDMVTLLWRS